MAKKQLEDWAVPHLHADKLRGTTGDQDTRRCPAWEKKASKPLVVKICVSCSSRRNSEPYGRVS